MVHEDPEFARIVGEQLGHIRGVLSYQIKHDEIVVVVAKDAPFIFSNIGGVPVRVIRSTNIGTTSTMTDQELCRTCQIEPLVGGVSIGEKDVTAGTLGLVVYDIDGSLAILSNNHVLANSNKARVGDAIIQPGVYDNGVKEVATLERFKKLAISSGDLPLLGSNSMDAALAKPLPGIPLSQEIAGIGKPTGINTVKIGDHVRKSGRTTGVTEGQVILDNATVRIDGYEGGFADFSGQVLTTPMMEGGDSGSVFVNDNNEVVGLGFAGSDAISVFTPIQRVIQELQIGITEPPSFVGQNGNAGAKLLGLLAIAGVILS